MGLLDEAIRDHLELKRRRGADPSEIARAEREALDPLAGDGSDEAVLSLEEPLEAEAPEAQLEEPAQPTEHVARDEGGEFEHDVTTAGQETVEIDMQALLEEEARAADDGTMRSAIRARALAGESAVRGESDADPLDWGVPARVPAEGMPEQIPGQERLSFE